MSKIKIPILIIIIVAITAAALIFINTKNRSKQQNKLNQESVQLPSPTPSLEDIQKAVAAQFNAKNFTKIADYMQKPNVEITIQSTECCMFAPPEQASSQLNFVEKGIPMDFSQNNQTIVDLKNKHREIKDAYVGISKNNTQLVAFFFNTKNEITGVTMAASWKIFNFNEQQPLPN